MSAPTITAASLDKASYAPNETMTLTVTYGDPDTKRQTVTIVVTDQGGNASAPVTVPVVIDPLTVSVTDDGSRTWTKVSDTGVVAVFTAKA